MTAVLLDYMKTCPVRCFELVDDGDDAGVIIEREDLNHLRYLSRHYQEVGFLLTREEPIDVFEEIEFCQSHPVWTETGWRMVRNITRALGRDALCYHRFQSPGEWATWRGAVAAGGLAGASDLPILGSFYKKLDSGVRGSRLELGWGLSRLNKGVVTGTAISDETRVSFYKAFGIPPSQQKYLEELIDGAPKPTFCRTEACIQQQHLISQLHAQ
jgi:hypothetical protein